MLPSRHGRGQNSLRRLIWDDLFFALPSLSLEAKSRELKA